MVEVIIDDVLENLAKMSGIELKQIVINAHCQSSSLGFKPADKVNIIAGVPGLTVANKESFGLLNIYLDRSIFAIEDQQVKQKTLFFHITHEFCHASIADIGLLEIVHYNLFGGKFVTSDSEEEFSHIINTLKENVQVDSRLAQDPELMESFLLSNMPDFIALKRRIKKIKRMNKSDSFHVLVELLHLTSVSRHIKINGYASGAYRTMATNFDSLFHLDLSMALRDAELMEMLKSIYDELLTLCNNGGNSTLIRNNLRRFWDQGLN